MDKLSVEEDFEKNFCIRGAAAPDRRNCSLSFPRVESAHVHSEAGSCGGRWLLSYRPWGHSVLNSISFVGHTDLPLTLSRRLKPSLSLLGQGGKELCLFCFWNFSHEIFRAARKSSSGDV